MTKHLDGKWARATSKAYERIKGKGRKKGDRNKQQWCFLCGEEHDYHEADKDV